MNRKLVIVLAVVVIAMVGAIAYRPLSNIWADHRYRAAPAATAPRDAAAREKAKAQSAVEAARHALPALRAATEHAPNDPAAWAKLGDAAMRTGDGPQAIATYRRSLAINSRQASIWSSLGEVYVETTPADGAHLPAPAKEAFGKAIAVDPSDLRARFYLAAEKDRTGLHEAAMTDWIAILASVPRGSQPDHAVRTAIGDSMRRDLAGLKDRLNAAMKAQPAG